MKSPLFSVNAMLRKKNTCTTVVYVIIDTHWTGGQWYYELFCPHNETDFYWSEEKLKKQYEIVA